MNRFNHSKKKKNTQWINIIWEVNRTNSDIAFLSSWYALQEIREIHLQVSVLYQYIFFFTFVARVKILVRAVLFIFSWSHFFACRGVCLLVWVVWWLKLAGSSWIEPRNIRPRQKNILGPGRASFCHSIKKLFHHPNIE